MHHFTVTLTYGRTLKYVRDMWAPTYVEAMHRAAMLFPRASTITVE